MTDQPIEPMTDEVIAWWRERVTTNLWDRDVLSLMARLDAEIARANAAEAERDAALARALPRPIGDAPKTAGVRIILGGMTSGPPVDIGQWGCGRYLGRRAGYRMAWVTNPGNEVNPTCWWPLPDFPIPTSEEG